MAKTFLYTELQASVPFDQAPWRELNPVLLRQKGLVGKTWLAGIGTHSVGGFYEFDDLEAARDFAKFYFPGEAGNLGAAQTTKLFDGTVVVEASRYLNAMHFGGTLGAEPGAYLYTEVQTHVPFDQAPWRELNPGLKTQPGLLHKTWLSGVGAQTVGGFYAFDTLENARRFALEVFPREAAALNAPFTTRLFDAAVVREASRQMKSPFYR